MSSKSLYPNFDSIECVEYKENFLPHELEKDIMKNLLKEIEFNTPEESSIVMMGKKINIPRRQVGYGEDDLKFYFTGTNVQAKKWNDAPLLLSLKNYIADELKIPISYVLINFYKDGNDYIGYHSDNENEHDPEYPILSLSIGQSRKFRFIHRITGKIYEQVLKHNSLCIMKPPCQKVYKHSLPKSKIYKYPRLNLTFRVIKKSQT